MSIEVRPLRGAAELAACVALQEETWGDGFSECVPPRLLSLAQRLGGVASGAFDGDRLVGFVFGITGVAEGHAVHWSDMLAVRPARRNHGLGEALKRHQRDVLLPLGVTLVRWTFDPLESRNAYLNFSRLGATAREYVRDFYGDSDSPLHRGLGTDRLVVRWEIAGERVRRRLAGETGPPAMEEVERLPAVNAPAEGDPPRPGEPDTRLDAGAVRIAIPAETQALKELSPELATEWRRTTRAAFEAYFARGYEAVELVRAGSVSWYVLERRG